MFPAGWGVAEKPCDSSESAAFLCEPEAGTALRPRERVWMCEVCERAPAVVTCKADAAALCATCDRDIHSANPLASRHDRVRIAPFFESSLSPAVASADKQNNNNNNRPVLDDSDEAEAASWILPNPVAHHKIAADSNPGNMKSSGGGGVLFFGGGGGDPFLDFEYAGFQQHEAAAGNDSVVPVQTGPHFLNDRPVGNYFDLDFSKSTVSPYSYASHSLSQSVSSDVGLVPDGNSVSDASYPFGKKVNGVGDAIGQPATAAQATQLSGSDREARVLRYKEKKKNRKFEKTIRYASRKAYAETRPRIKGRFAKRTEMDDGEGVGGGGPDDFYGSAAFDMVDAGYGVVPSF